MNIQKYSLALLISFESSKNTSAVSRAIDVNQSEASRFLKKVSIQATDFIKLIAKLFGSKKLTLVIDDFTISRRYAEETEGASSVIDQSIKWFTHGVTIVAAGLTDGQYFLPLDLEQWIAEFISKDEYLTKAKLAEKLITKILSLELALKYCVLDGLYFSEDLINFMNKKGLFFVIKAKTTTKVLYQGKLIQLKAIKGFSLNSNQSQKKIKAIWREQSYFFVRVRRTGKHGEKMIYLIANFCAKTKVYRRIYDSRWTIEKFIRTGKQKLGLKSSYSTQAVVYTNHIKCVFYAYAILQLIMKKFRLKSAEDALRTTQARFCKSNFDHIYHQVSLLVSHA